VTIDRGNYMEIYNMENGHIVLQEGLSDFNGNKYLLKKQKKVNHKYYVYDKSTGKPVNMEYYLYEKMSIIDIVKQEDYQLIFYVDTNNRLSFVKAKYHKVLDPEDMIDKIEKTPFNSLTLFRFLNALLFIGVLRFRAYSFDEISISFGYDKSINVKAHFLFSKKIREKFAMNTKKPFLLVHLFWCRVPFKELYKHYVEQSDINVPAFIKVTNDNFNYYYSLKLNSKDKYAKNHYIYNTPSYSIRSTTVELFARKSISGQIVIVFTSMLQKTIMYKEKFAYFCSRFVKNKEIYNIYFEKFCEGASESAFEVFKQAVKQDEHAVFILSPDHHAFKQLQSFYPNRILAKNSFQAFYKIFLANSFISSDLATHIQRRLYDNDSLIKKKILSTNKKILLQHGVCLATNVFERGYYNTKVPIAPDYIVVNSTFEKQMFENYTNYDTNRLIATGLPNMDLYTESRNVQKDEITFLLTWRPWDLTANVEDGSYLARYKQFIDLVNQNSFYQDKKVNIILHPKARNILEEQFPEFYSQNERYFYEGDIKDALLKSKVLISDYSSVTFFGFAGGSNIVFYWEDKELAEKMYGAPNILQKDIAFGDVIYDFHMLHVAIEKNYVLNQVPAYKEIFDMLVEYKDGNNTEETLRFINKNILHPTNKNEKRFFKVEEAHTGGVR
jgi:CDP-glycerol glycerophosphotransferase (TagB/SpsB family)